MYVTAHLPWVTRRCAVTRTFIQPTPLAAACIDWLQAYRDLLANRIRWVYHATLYTGKPAFGGEAGEERGSSYPFRNLPDAPQSGPANEDVDLSAYVVPSLAVGGATPSRCDLVGGLVCSQLWSRVGQAAQRVWSRRRGSDEPVWVWAINSVHVFS